MCQNDFRAKETEAYIAELSMFFKGQHELKTLNVLFLPPDPQWGHLLQNLLTALTVFILSDFKK